MHFLLAKANASPILERMIQRIKFMVTCFLLCVFIPGCGSSLRISERWEGIKENRLRVYVRDTLPEDSPRYGEENREPILMDNAHQRAALILSGYIVMRTGSAEGNPEVLNLKTLIQKILESGRIVLSDEETEYTAAYVEYDITILQNELSRIDSSRKTGEPETRGGVQ